ncbi:MAG: polysaccharide pyruvyl transferase family protein [Clostridia bacterium]|nr:polysaccharide pyruvyl transferase family protein [Clostridia bacterium]
MKIIIHGSTFGSNFGDCLFAKMFYDFCEKKYPDSVKFYENNSLIRKDLFTVSEHYRDYMNYQKTFSKKDLAECDCMVYMAGGYFGETTTSLKEAVIRYWRYMKFGYYAIRHKKPIAIIGVGAGPISKEFLRRKIKKIFNYASLITVRNEESKKYLEEIGVKNEIIVTSDVAQMVDKSFTSKLEDKTLTNIKESIGNKKIILLHCSTQIKHINIIKEKILFELSKYAVENDYGIVLCVDQCDVSRIEELTKMADILECPFYVYNYENPSKLISLIDFVDIVVTSKLHVGILSCSLNKSVYSFPFNKNKIVRYYKQIGYPERCIPVGLLKNNDVYNLMKKYGEEKIILSDEIKNLSENNFKFLGEFLDRIYRKSGDKIA